MNITDKTFFRYIMVGIANTVFGTAIMFIFYNVFHFSYWVSSASNYFFGSILSYLLNKYFTFRFHEKGWASLWRFILNILICYLIAYGIAKPLMKWLLNDCSKTVQENIAMLTGMCLFVLLNYLGQRYFTFIHKNKPS